MCKTAVLKGQSHVNCTVSGNRRIRIDAIVPEIAFTTNVRKIHFSELVIVEEVNNFLNFYLYYINLLCSWVLEHMRSFTRVHGRTNR